MKITRKSRLTGIVRTLEIPCTPEQLADWENGTYIQNAMPNLSAADREFIMTGISQDEWDKMVAIESDDGDEYTGPCYPEYDE